MLRVLCWQWDCGVRGAVGFVGRVWNLLLVLRGGVDDVIGRLLVIWGNSYLCFNKYFLFL